MLPQLLALFVPTRLNFNNKKCMKFPEMTIAAQGNVNLVINSGLDAWHPFTSSIYQRQTKPQAFFEKLLW